MADKEHLPECVIEKDWWVSITLKALFQTLCKDYLEFKGGTSLSKGWHLIDRFSEDIDLALNYRFFVPRLDNNTQLKNLRKKSRKFIVDTLAEDLDSKLKALGLSGYEVKPEVNDDAGNPISSDADPTVIIADCDCSGEVSEVIVTILEYKSLWNLDALACKAHCRFTLIDVESGYRGGFVNVLYHV